MKTKMGKKHYRQLITATHGAGRMPRSVPDCYDDGAILQLLQGNRRVAMQADRYGQRPFPAAG